MVVNLLTGQTAIFMNYVSLFNIQQKVDESIASFASHIWDIYDHLSAGGIVLDKMVLTLIMMNGLSDDCDGVKTDFALNCEKYAQFL